MPLYEYRCAGCGTVYDVLHMGKEERDEVVCPSCGSREHTRLISAAATLSRGSRPDTPCGDPDACCGGRCATGADSWN